jgi:hypothetical protein
MTLKSLAERYAKSMKVDLDRFRVTGRNPEDDRSAA